VIVTVKLVSKVMFLNIRNT